MEITNWYCALGLLLQWLSPVGMEWAQPILAFQCEDEDRGFNSPLHWCGPASQFRSAGGDSPDKVVLGRNSGPRGTCGWQ
jgi:hypothetical protein